jgi:hypothetical protein
VAALSHPTITTKTLVFFFTKLNIITSNAHSPNNRNRKEFFIKKTTTILVYPREKT